MKIDPRIPSIQPIVPKATESVQTDQAQKGQGFGEMLKNAIQEVDSLQKQADAKIQGVTLGAPGATMHDAAIALQKADVAFQLMTTIRSKIVRAYDEIMRSPV